MFRSLALVFVLALISACSSPTAPSPQPSAEQRLRMDAVEFCKMQQNPVTRDFGADSTFAGRPCREWLNGK